MTHKPKIYTMCFNYNGPLYRGDTKTECKICDNFRMPTIRCKDCDKTYRKKATFKEKDCINFNPKQAKICKTCGSIEWI